MNPTIKKHKKKVIGYKALRKDKKGYYTDGMGNTKRTYFEVGKTYTVKGELELCKNGLHFFRNYCFAINYLETENIICKVESLGDVAEDTEKCVTNKLKILEIEYSEKVDGNYNSGDRNSGHCNAGYHNSGDYNAGDGYKNFFCTKTRYFLFDIECTEKEAFKSRTLDMSWFDLSEGYKEAWKKCPKEVLKEIKELKNFNKDKFKEISGLSI